MKPLAKVMSRLNHDGHPHIRSDASYRLNPWLAVRLLHSSAMGSLFDMLLPRICGKARQTRGLDVGILWHGNTLQPGHSDIPAERNMGRCRSSRGSLPFRINKTADEGRPPFKAKHSEALAINVAP